MKQQYNSTDLLKFCASIGIVSIHIAPISVEHKIFCEGLSFLTSLCVPLFFVVSAFLFSILLSSVIIEMAKINKMKYF